MIYLLPPVAMVAIISGVIWTLIREEKIPNQKLITNMDKNKHLDNVLKTHSMGEIEALVAKFRGRRDEIKEFIQAEYKSKMHTMINSGSYAKKTAVNNKFDLDTIGAFKRNSFSTLEEMLDEVYKKLKKEFEESREVAKVRKQTVSVGLEFYEDEDGDIVQIDVVPGRELNQDQYLEDKKLNLYINSNEKKQSIQTNIDAQIEHIKGKDKERNIIKLLKIWKKEENYKIKSFFLELITIEAFKYKGEDNLPRGIWEQLKMTLEYIRDEVIKENFTLVDPGNSNNKVEESLDTVARKKLSNRISNILKSIESDGDLLEIYFPENENHKEVSYSEKGSGATSLSSSNRFG